jgi:hypothetical protein
MLFISAHFAFAAISNTRTKIHKRKKKLEKNCIERKTPQKEQHQKHRHQ